MWTILKWLLDFDAPAIRSLESVRVQYAGGVPLLAALGLFLTLGAAIAMASYVRPTEYIRRRNRWLFGGLRFLVYVALAVGLSGVTLLLRLGVAENPDALVIVDDSLSMGIALAGRGPGDGSGPTRMDRVKTLLADGFLEDLARVRTVGLRRLGSPAQLLPATTQLAPTAAHSDLPTALADVLNATAGNQRLREIVLLTDGVSTVAPDYLELRARLINRGVRLFPVLVDDDPALRDIRIESVRSTPYCRAFDQLHVAYTIQSRGYAGETATVDMIDLREPDVPLQSQTLPIAADARHRGVFSLPPFMQAGKVELLVRVRPLPGERVIENNAARLFVTVVDEPIKVLYIDNFPRAEFLHTKWSLDRDPNLALTSMTRLPGGGWLVQGDNVPLENPEAGFPGDLGELLKYDVLILGSISRGYFSAGDAQFETKLNLIGQFVSGRGGGLIVAGGHRSYGQGRYHGSPLAALLPFEIPEYGNSTYLTAPFQAELTELGGFHPIVQLAESDEANRRLWSELPPLAGCNRVGAARPGAQVLAVAGETVAGEKPILLAVRAFGKGRVLASTAYSTYRWRLGYPVEDGFDPLMRFWRQAVRYVAPDPRLIANDLNLDLGGQHYTRGETYELVCRPLDAHYEPVGQRVILVDVTAPDGSRHTLALRDARDRPGIYAGYATFEQTGRHTIHAYDRQDDERQSVAEIVVGESTAEFQYVGEVDRQLAATAEASGGRVVRWADIDALPVSLERAPIARTAQVAAPLWASPLLLLLIVLAAALEWFLRKRNALA